MKKYYFVFTWYSAYQSEWKPQTFVCDIHPFERVKYFNTMEGYETALASWQEINKEEFDRYKAIENGSDDVLSEQDQI